MIENLIGNTVTINVLMATYAGETNASSSYVGEVLDVNGDFIKMKVNYAFLSSDVPFAGMYLPKLSLKKQPINKIMYFNIKMIVSIKCE